jgi:hypothetical protein
LMAERNEFSDPESATADAPRPKVAIATTRRMCSQRVFPSMWGDIDHEEWFL